MPVLNLKVHIRGPKQAELSAAVPASRYHQAVDMLKVRAQMAARDAVWSMIQEMATWGEPEWRERCENEAQD